MYTNKERKRFFAPVVPLSIAHTLQTFNMLGNYHLLLAHDVLEHPEKYKKVFLSATSKNEPQFITMDNSLIELGFPMRIRDVIEAARVVNANKVVLPDVLGNLEETITMASQAFSEFLSLPKDITVGIRMVGVVQGQNQQECFRCLDVYNNRGLDISIPRVLVDILGTRREIIQKAYSMGFRNMHLLGFSNNLIDDISCTRMPGVSGIDSAVPIRAGLKHKRISLDDRHFSDILGPRGDYWQTDTKDTTFLQTEMVMQNIATFRDWINC